MQHWNRSVMLYWEPAVWNDNERTPSHSSDFSYECCARVLAANVLKHCIRPYNIERHVREWQRLTGFNLHII